MRPLDDVDHALLEHLQASGRMTLAELARRVGMSPPGVAERLRRLEDDDVIVGYTAVVNPDRLGFHLLAFIRVGTFDPVDKAVALNDVLARPEIIEAHHVVGEDCWIFKVAVRDTAHLERLLLFMARIGATTTSIVLSSPVHRRPLRPGTGIEE